MSKRTDAPNLEGNDLYEGYCADLARELTKRLNIKFTINVVKDGQFGKKFDNNTWNGMVGELVRNVSIAV